MNWQIFGLIFFSLFLAFYFGDEHIAALFSAGMTYGLLLSAYDSYLDYKKRKRKEFKYSSHYIEELTEIIEKKLKEEKKKENS